MSLARLASVAEKADDGGVAAVALHEPLDREEALLHGDVQLRPDGRGRPGGGQPEQARDQSEDSDDVA
jgi:hypothetical protein